MIKMALFFGTFLQHFSGTVVENLIEAYSQLSENKIQLSLFQDNVLNFTNAVQITELVVGLSPTLC
jgi:hypothetical protein